MLSFVHTADWQLGMTRRFLPPEAQARFDDARLAAVERIGALADEYSCAFVIVAGDAFESNHIGRSVVLRAAEALSGIPVPVYLLPGNHDPLDPASVYRTSEFKRHQPPNVFVLQDLTPVEAVPGVWLYPAPWLSKRPAENPCREALARLGRPKERSGATGERRILVAHGGADVAPGSADDPLRLPVAALECAVAEAQVDYVALGDRHSTTQLVPGLPIWYSGSPEATDFDEVSSGRALVISMSEDGGPPTVRSESVGRWQFLARRWPMLGADDIQALVQWLERLDRKRETVVRLAFVGSLSVGDKAYLDDQLARFGELFAAILPWERETDLAVHAEDGDFADLGLEGFAADALAELRARAQGTDTEAEVARDALSLLWRLARSG